MVMDLVSAMRFMTGPSWADAAPAVASAATAARIASARFIFFLSVLFGRRVAGRLAPLVRLLEGSAATPLGSFGFMSWLADQRLARNVQRSNGLARRASK